MKQLKRILSPFLIIPALIFTACSSTSSGSGEVYLPESKNDVIITSVGFEDDMRVSFIDVGQGDSEFIELPNGETLLIDAGTNETGVNVTDYISSLGYTSIDYVVGTHPHEDHIGGLDDVIYKFDIGSLYMPKITADTKTFEDVLDAAEEKGLMINTAKAGVTIVDTDDLSVKMLAPTLDSYKNTNDYSAVIKVVYGDTSFLFTGDAEEFSESLITDDVKADVLKAGHHGSSTSTSDDFLSRVSPSRAVISCGQGNPYGHPHEETLSKFTDAGITVYRTDTQGTITAVSDGNSITFDVQKDNGAVAPADNTGSADGDNIQENSITYVLNTNSKKIHLPDCSAVDSMSDKNKAFTDNYDQAINEGYVPCRICNP